MMYADDKSQSMKSKTVESLEEKMSEDLECTVKWMKANKLSIRLKIPF